MTRHRKDSVAPSVKDFERECYSWWRDGCSCVACRVVDLFEQGRMTGFLMDARMKILYDVSGGVHADGVWLGQLGFPAFKIAATPGGQLPSQAHATAAIQRARRLSQAVPKAPNPRTS